MSRTLTITAVGLLLTASSVGSQSVSKPIPLPSEPGETHLRNIRQLTNGGENAEAYFSHDGKRLIFQSTRDGRSCDQQYVMRIDGSQVRRVSRGVGKTTCGYFMNGDRRILFASSEALEKDCPPRPDPSKGYVWRLDPFDIYTAYADGSRQRRLTNFGVYTAEGVLSPDGKKIVFTSLKNGDLDIYVMNIDGSDIRQLTHQLGYDSGPWWSPDGRHIVFQSSRSGKEEIWSMLADGTKVQQLTFTGRNTQPNWSWK